MQLRISTAPHMHNPLTTQKIMLYVLLSLLPASAFGVYAFGLKALLLIAVSIASAVLSEYLWQKIGKKPILIGDLSAAVTGLILALNLPVGAPWWVAVIGSAFSVIIVKQLFGGIGDNFMNPAMAGRAILLASWPVHMTTYVVPTFFRGTDAVTTATPLSSKAAGYMDLLLGRIPGTIGEISKIAILVGFFFLLITGVVSWRIPVTMTASVFVVSWLFGMDPVASVLSGGVLFGAVFMATDYATSPMLPLGQFIYAAGIGLIVALVRAFGNYPEGVTFGILLMNIASPLIDRFTPRKIYGHDKEAKKA